MSRRHVERELARARIGPSSGNQSRVRTIADGVVGVVRRTPTAQRLLFEVHVAAEVTAPMDEGDLTEIFGNLIENASRFSRSTVWVEASTTAERATIIVTDDGPGIPESDRLAVLSRGVSLDSRPGGSGLGLAIVADIVEAYGGTLTLSDAGPGLRVTIQIPKHAPAITEAVWDAN